MTRLVLAAMVLLAPLAATSSLAQDVAYWQAAGTWQTASPVTYYTHTLVASLLAATLYRNYRRRRDGP